VIHYTAAGSAKGSVSWLCNPVSKVSAHYVISRQGGIYQLVDLARAAWHAGDLHLNKTTIGIELANHGYLAKDGKRFFYYLGKRRFRYRGPAPVQAPLCYESGLEFEGWWEPYPEAQLCALGCLIAYLRTTPYRRALERIDGHSELAEPPGRKKDPGPLFPWNLFR
jgi:N-acetylmuramoyl-L-alanine amidase